MFYDCIFIRTKGFLKFMYAHKFEIIELIILKRTANSWNNKKVNLRNQAKNKKFDG